MMRASGLPTTSDERTNCTPGMPCNAPCSCCEALPSVSKSGPDSSTSNCLPESLNKLARTGTTNWNPASVIAGPYMRWWNAASESGWACSGFNTTPPPLKAAPVTANIEPVSG